MLADRIFLTFIALTKYISMKMAVLTAITPQADFNMLKYSWKQESTISFSVQNLQTHQLHLEQKIKVGDHRSFLFQIDYSNI